MRALFLLLPIIWNLGAKAQNTIAFQGFESPPDCPEWGYTGGVVNTETARTGARSARAGRSAESTTITFNTVTVSGYANVQLVLYHSVRPVIGGGGEAMDTDEGAVVQVRLNGGAWTAQGTVSGFNNTSWGWALSPGGNAFSGCGNTMPNPLVYNAPAGTNTIAVRVFSTKGGCPGTTAGNYDRTDEGFFIDDVRLTTTSPVITPGSGTVTWTGAIDTDWFNCLNWNPQLVPGPGWDAIIDQGSSNHCVIGMNASTPLDAYAATLIVRSNNATLRNLTINNGRSLTVGGLVTVQRTAGTGQFGITVQNGSFTSGGLTLTGTGSNQQQALFRNIVNTNAVQINGNVNINQGGILDIQGAPGGILGVAGDLNNNDVAAAFPKTGSWVVLNGGGPQSMYCETITGELYASLRVAKSGGDVTLNAPISVSGTLDLQQGRIFSTAANLLHMQAGSSVINVSNASFVSGPVRKRGNTAFTFPVGKGNHYRPIAISTLSGNATLFFTAEYFMGDPTVAFGIPCEPPLHHVSRCEWWILDRSSTQTAFVTLSWDAATSCGVTLLSDLRVAEWYDGALPTAMWHDRGNGGTTGSTASGTVITSSAQSLFSAPTPWTLASLSSENPLPITLLSFTAEARGVEVLTQWTTLSERDNERFDVERSADGILFERVGTLPGAGNSITSLHYLMPDPRPLPDLSYYRLRQVDFDGRSSLSPVVPVRFGTRGGTGITVLYDGPDAIAMHDLPVGARYQLLDARGRTVMIGAITEEGRLRLSLEALGHGVYLLRMDDGHRMEATRLVR